MSDIKQLFENNKNWSKRKTGKDPDYFHRLASLQAPQYLWIGCSDSRVPANQILGLMPGEIFVHRNVGNLVINTDLNCLSVLQYAVEILKVKDIIICGHYGCGGVHAACQNRQLGLIDNWLRTIKDTYSRNSAELDKIKDAALREDRLCELNVQAQVANICNTTIVQNAWERGQTLAVHGLIYRLDHGLLNPLILHINGPGKLEDIYKMGQNQSGVA